MSTTKTHRRCFTSIMWILKLKRVHVNIVEPKYTFQTFWMYVPSKPQVGSQILNNFNIRCTQHHWHANPLLDGFSQVLGILTTNVSHPRSRNFIYNLSLALLRRGQISALAKLVSDASKIVEAHCAKSSKPYVPSLDDTEPYPLESMIGWTIGRERITDCVRTWIIEGGCAQLSATVARPSHTIVNVSWHNFCRWII